MLLKPMSKLEAINQMLMAIGGDVINSLRNQDEADPDISSAIQKLDSVSREVQSTGWKFNKRTNYLLARDADKTIKVPLNTLRVDPPKGTYPVVDFTENQGKLYDLIKNTFEFEADQLVDIVFLFDFDDLPNSVKIYIAKKAAREFVSSQAPDDMSYRTASKEEVDAKAAFWRDQTLRRSNSLRNRYS